MFLHPHCSVVWDAPACVQFLQTVSVQADQCGELGELWVVHNLPNIRLPEMPCVKGFGISWEAAVWCGIQAARVIKEPSTLNLPAEFDAQRRWVQSSLANSTKALAADSVSPFICEDVCAMLTKMVRGREVEHLNLLYRVIDSRGSDVRLNSGAVLDGVRQLAPYPAFAWQWTSVQSYRWVSPQHINVLELLACFNYLCFLVTRPNGRCCRIFHILDSRVSSCVLTKGRSSSRILNRTLRRIAALVVGADLSVQPLWTISAWNFSDTASRAVPGRPDG